jgi:small subunit ribosomal protein S4
MTRYTGPKNRIARRFGANIFGRLRNPLLHKASPAGMHGGKKRKRSDYGLQLLEQQKLKALYGMLTRSQIVRYYKEALRRKGNTADLFIQRLECRLDNVLYRLKFAPTIFAAQQLVSHGHVLVNGKKVDRRSFEVKPGMMVSLKEKAQSLPVVKSAQENASRAIPDYMSADGMTGQVLTLPHVDQVPHPIPINMPMICEHLAHTS